MNTAYYDMLILLQQQTRALIQKNAANIQLDKDVASEPKQAIQAAGSQRKIFKAKRVPVNFVRTCSAAVHLPAIQ